MHRQHRRGPHPEDALLFGASMRDRLRAAAEEITWLEGRGWPREAAVTAVGNHHQLHLRQRIALGRACAPPAGVAARLGRALAPAGVAGRTLQIDGFNLVIAVEVALGGGLLVEGADGCLRDLAGLRGSYHPVDDTNTALQHIGTTLAALDVGGTVWLLDQAVSNSGRLRGLILEASAAWPGTTTVELVPNADPLLAVRDMVVTADAAVLDRCGRWANLAAWTIARHVPAAWIVRL